MSATIPYNRSTSHFEPQTYPVSLSSYMDEATFRECISRLNQRCEQVGKGHVKLISGVFLLILALFIAGWVMFGVGLGISSLGLIVAGIVTVIVSVFIACTSGAIYTSKQGLALHAGVEAENQRFKNNQPPITFRLGEQRISNWNGSYHDSHIEYTLFIEVGKPFQASAQPDKVGQTAETSQVGAGPASQTVNDAPTNDHPARDWHSIHIVHPAKII